MLCCTLSEQNSPWAKERRVILYIFKAMVCPLIMRTEQRQDAVFPTVNDNYQYENTSIEPGVRNGSDETYYTIRDLAELSGVKQHTIRVWEKRFDILSPQRTEGSRRLYTTEQLIYFLEVSLLKQNGYRLSRIAHTSKEERNGLISRIHGQQYHSRIQHELICCMLRMELRLFEEILERFRNEQGIHETIKSVITPFARRIGLFNFLGKKTYRRNIYLASECLKRKLYLAIESIPGKVDTGHSVLLFTSAPFTEFPLLLISYLIKMEGFATIYLGRNFSIADMNMICQSLQPRFIVTHLFENYHGNVLPFVRSMPEKFPGCKFISTGATLPTDRQLHCHHIRDLSQISTAFQIT